MKEGGTVRAGVAVYPNSSFTEGAVVSTGGRGRRCQAAFLPLPRHRTSAERQLSPWKASTCAAKPLPSPGHRAPTARQLPLDKLGVPSFPPEGIGRPQHGSFPLDKLGVPSFPPEGIGRPQHGSFGDHFHDFVPVDSSKEHGGPPPGSAPGGIVSSFRPPRPQQGFPPPGSAPGGIVSSFRPPKPQQGSPPPGSAPGGIVSSFRPPKPSRPFKPAGPTGSGLRPGIAPGEGGPVIPILVDERDGPHADGTYSFNFETGNGISRQEQGYPQDPQGAVESQGGWSFTFPDGTPGVFNFVADENGYRIESDLLPTPHPLPAHALAQIEFARQQEAQVKPQPHGDYGR
ncbi:basic salivary proline-rich protein 2-like [Portunus trituberculatus]|uniref:basic salivary proline-rich protein 2-like n=1 Tax=Portunus trituberculatus TaxID=210409 RepID=UPI001E1D0B65|nr:basic salivary proline-rich protein 2-like [Portunus trituberculatus]